MMEDKTKTKVCTTCNSELPATNEFFSKDNRSKSGLQSTCKICRKQYRKDNAEYIAEHNKNYRKENSEKISLQRKQYYEDNAEKIIAVNMQYAKENPEKKAASNKRYAKANSEKIATKNKKWREDNPEKRAAGLKKWIDANPEQGRIRCQRRRAHKKELPCTLTLFQWNTAKEHFDNQCAYCGEDRFLEQEHFIALSQNGEYTLNNIIPACRSCNSSKSDKDFFKWYPTHDSYNKTRERKILDYLNLL